MFTVKSITKFLIRYFMVFRHLPITAAIDEPLSQPFPPLPRPGANQAPLHSPEAVAEGDLLAALDKKQSRRLSQLRLSSLRLSLLRLSLLRRS